MPGIAAGTRDAASPPKSLTAMEWYYSKTWRPSAWTASSVMTAELIFPGMEFERISVMRELANLPLRVVFSRLVAAAIFPVVQRWFMSREK